MKKYILAGIVLALVIAATTVILDRGKASALSVSEVGSDPAAFSGTIAITGITYGFSTRDASIFGIMDVKELQCQSQNCNKLILPVKFDGKLPAVGDEVSMSGRFVNTAEGYVFTAEQVKVLRNHKLGGQG